MARLIKIADWSGSKRASIIFVHGLSGHPYDTWRNKTNSGAFWPLWLAEDIQGISVYSVGYFSPATDWRGTAMPILDEAAHILRLLLNEDELRDGPIVFICHSMGGIIVKQIIRSAYEQSGDPKIRDFVSRIRQVVFIATPHTGSGKASLLEKFRYWTLSSNSTRNLVANRPELRDLNFGYREIIKNLGYGISHLSYYEMGETAVGKIVEPDSADPGIVNCRPTPIHRDHVKIAKPSRRDDLVYQEVRNAISKLGQQPKNAGDLIKYPLEKIKFPVRLSSALSIIFRIIRLVILTSFVLLLLIVIFSLLYQTLESTRAIHTKINSSEDTPWRIQIQSSEFSRKPNRALFIFDYSWRGEPLSLDISKKSEPTANIWLSISHLVTIYGAIYFENSSLSISETNDKGDIIDSRHDNVWFKEEIVPIYAVGADFTKRLKNTSTMRLVSEIIRSYRIGHIVFKFSGDEADKNVITEWLKKSNAYFKIYVQKPEVGMDDSDDCPIVVFIPTTFSISFEKVGEIDVDLIPATPNIELCEAPPPW